MKRFITNGYFSNAALLLATSLVFTLYLAPSPSKYGLGDFFALLILIAFSTVFKFNAIQVVNALKPLTPLFLLAIYAILIGLLKGVDGGFIYAANILIGVLPYLTFYWIAKNTQEFRMRGLMLAAFLAPGLIHLGYMYLDIVSSIIEDKIVFSFSSRQGLLEYVKDSPRVGRRYLSVALTHLIVGGMLLGLTFKHSKPRRFAAVIILVAVLSLAVLDARTAYFSILVGCLVMLCTPIFRSTIKTTFSLLIKHRWASYVFGLMAIVAVALAYSSGKSRWQSMEYSVIYAVKDTSAQNKSTSPLPFVDRNYWGKPIANIKECYEEKKFRCMVDQSAYLRVAWLLSGISTVLANPFGIAYSENYMERVFAEKAGENKYKKTDSFLLEVAIAFGYVGIVLWAWMFGTVVHAVSTQSQQAREHNVVIALVATIIFACLARSMIDVVSDGLWRYLMALLGLFYGLLHSDRKTTNDDLENV